MALKTLSHFIIFGMLLFYLFITGGTHVVTAQQELPSITATECSAHPGWAIMQRRLMDEIGDTAPLFIEKFTYPGMSLTRHGKPDDDMECYTSWPLFYIIGGDDWFLDKGMEGFDAVIRQWTYTPGNYYVRMRDEMMDQYDMLHLSEGYVIFQHICLADKDVQENKNRARRYGEMYADSTWGNYDPEQKIIRSVQTGSAGAADTYPGVGYMINYGHATLSPIIEEIEEGWSEDPERRKEIQAAFDSIVTRCDCPMNMAICGLMTNAYLMTGDEKYRNWVIEYVDSWIELTDRNGGIIPDNVGRNGIIGEYRDGQWWGGFFGWNSRYSITMIYKPLITACECAYLLTGNDKYVEFLRSQIHVVTDRAEKRHGSLLIPFKYGREGWQDYRPLKPYILSHLWHLSYAAEDWELIERFRKGTKYGPWDPPAALLSSAPKEGEELWEPDSTILDWKEPINDHRHNERVLNEPGYLTYIGNLNPSWPERLLAAEYEHVHIVADRLRNPNWEHEWKSQTVLEQNPVQVNALRQLTMGGPPVNFNGGMLMTQVRYFDIERKRPGLPEGVAALVSKIDASGITLNLVNTDIMQSSRLIVQAGAYAQHDFTVIEYEEVAYGTTDEETGYGLEGYEIGRRYRRNTINGERFIVELPPGTSIVIECSMQRFVNDPTYAEPWN